MTGLKSRVVYRRPDGKWVHKRADRLSATSIHDSRQDAETTAKAMLDVFGGGKLTVVEQGTSVTSIRSEGVDTVAPVNV